MRLSFWLGAVGVVGFAVIGAGCSSDSGSGGSSTAAATGGGQSQGGSHSTAGVKGAGTSSGATAGTGGSSSSNAGTGGTTGGGGESTSAGSTGLGGDTNLPASDDFTGAALDSEWSVFRPELVDLSLNEDALVLVPHPNVLWYQASQGVLVYKLVTGDFKATSTVHVGKASNPATPPDLPIELGGVMARNPEGSQENYVFIVIGFGEQGHVAVEHKDTTNNDSFFEESPWGTDAELRLCRVGSSFSVYKRNPGDTDWGEADYETTRDDLPATLQVGPNTYAAQATPDFQVTLDSFSFEPVAGGCSE